MGRKIMKTIIKEKDMIEWSKEEIEKINSIYGCELIYQNATSDQIKDTSLPSDAYLVYYRIENDNYVDICRGKRKVDVFDLYYDKLGSSDIKKIDFGYGRTRPSIWGYKIKESKKKK